MIPTSSYLSPGALRRRLSALAQVSPVSPLSARQHANLMPTASPHEMDGSFTVGRVNFDNQDGLGSTPMGGNVIYEGAVAWIRPSVFLKLARKGDRADTVAALLPLVERGRAIAAPFLRIKLPDFKNTQQLTAEDVESMAEPIVIGHEGRARAQVFRALNGDGPMPVQLHFLGFRARHLVAELFDALERIGIKNEAKTLVVLPKSVYYYWERKLLRTSPSTA